MFQPNVDSLEDFVGGICDGFYITDSEKVDVFESIDPSLDPLSPLRAEEANNTRRGGHQLQQNGQDGDSEPRQQGYTIADLLVTDEESGPRPEQGEAKMQEPTSSMAVILPTKPAQTQPCQVQCVALPFSPSINELLLPRMSSGIERPLTSSSRAWAVLPASPNDNCIPFADVLVFIRQARSKRDSFCRQLPSEMYAHPYTYSMLIRLEKIRPPPEGSPINITYDLNLVDAETVAVYNDALAGDLPASHSFKLVECGLMETEGRIWIDKKYLSYKCNNKQFRFSLSIYQSAQLVVQCISAPCTVYSKRKEPVHEYKKNCTKKPRLTAALCREHE
eukprot:TRINITY_DN66986_c3_g1_i1.p1 TRINITY_DN66986_c3_g1~~TRINITY_DN66986_c3_g1_i1.p1  ORF type:complete len:334 (+),score=16.87 TRINITY_DN66986_c3_g1_i1:555-1556(+)